MKRSILLFLISFLCFSACKKDEKSEETIDPEIVSYVFGERASFMSSSQVSPLAEFSFKNGTIAEILHTNDGKTERLLHQDKKALAISLINQTPDFLWDFDFRHFGCVECNIYYIEVTTQDGKTFNWFFGNDTTQFTDALKHFVNNLASSINNLKQNTYNVTTPCISKNSFPFL